MLERSYIPVKPFEEFKWQWACLTCTEGLNDPVVLLGVLQRMYKLEPLGVKYSSEEFAIELRDLSKAIEDAGIGVDISRRTGERNLIRNSGQYWSALRLIDTANPTRKGVITLTDLGRRVAAHEISQAEFAALTIQTLTLPNTAVMPTRLCREWTSKGLFLTPLRLILQILFELNKRSAGNGFIRPLELIRIIIPLSCTPGVTIADYANFVEWNREGLIDLDRWPNCCVASNDKRMAREFLLFLSNYGYLLQQGNDGNALERYSLNSELLDEIQQIITAPNDTADTNRILQVMRETQVVSDVERKRVRQAAYRPNQANFRRAVIKACGRCVISGAEMPEILEAAHIKPYKYKGEDTIANGFAMRVDIHTLFDAGHLRISPDGDVELSPKAKNDYGTSLPRKIFLPEFTNREFLRWRWDNYNGM